MTIPLLLLAGGCATGPEVRVAGDATGWKPSRVAILPAAVATTAIPPARNLPDGEAPPAALDAARAVEAALEAALRDRAALADARVVESFTRSGSGAAADKLARQYLETRAVDPTLPAAVADEAGADALLLVAILRYGPESEGDLQRTAQSATAPVSKTSDLAVSVAGSSALVYYNAQFRAALVRAADGVIVWDVGVREHVKRNAYMGVTQAVVLSQAAAKLAGVFPWLKPPPQPAAPAPRPQGSAPLDTPL